MASVRLLPALCLTNLMWNVSLNKGKILKGLKMLQATQNDLFVNTVTVKVALL